MGVELLMSVLLEFLLLVGVEEGEYNFGRFKQKFSGVLTEVG